MGVARERMQKHVCLKEEARLGWFWFWRCARAENRVRFVTVLTCVSVEFDLTIEIKPIERLGPVS